MTLLLLCLLGLPTWLVFFNEDDMGGPVGAPSQTIRVLTVQGPTTFYRSPDGPAGFEYELMSAFAEKLGRKLEVEIVDSTASILPRLRRGDAHFAAAGLSVNFKNSEAQPTVPYQKINGQVVVRRGNKLPAAAKDLVGMRIFIPGDSIYNEYLSSLRDKYPDLTWSTSPTASQEDALVAVWEGRADVTIAGSNVVTVVRQHYPDLSVAFGLDLKHGLSWFFPSQTGDQLFDSANSFIKNSGNDIGMLIERYYGSASKADYINVVTFRRRVRTKLPVYEHLFKLAGAESLFDWRLIASLSYQESYWDPGAVSPTGVRGIMQLTKDTARLLKVKDRTDPVETIPAGARYLRWLHERIPDSVSEPDRTWFALAAYNVGLGHVYDARKLTAATGGQADHWQDLKTALLRLTDERWHSQTKHGFARGNEAVAYVNRIRSFYDIMNEMKTDPARLYSVGLDVPAL